MRPDLRLHVARARFGEVRTGIGAPITTAPILPTIPSCLPSWWPEILAIPDTIVHDPAGCAPGAAGTDESIPCDPITLLNHANAYLAKPVSLSAYALARMIPSEVGDADAQRGSPVERAVVAVAIANQAKARGISPATLLLQNETGIPRFGVYGSVGHGRVASTGDAPTLRNLSIAQGVLSGRLALPSFVDADQFIDPAAQDALYGASNDTAAQISSHYAGGKVWIGPQVGIDAHRLLVFRPLRQGESKAVAANDIPTVLAVARTSDPSQGITTQCYLTSPTTVLSAAAGGAGMLAGGLAAVLL